MRTFVAVEVPASLQRRMASEARRLAGPGDRIRWVAPPRLHVTLRFLGPVREDRIPRVTQALLATSRQAAAFAASLRGMGTFPPRGRPRVVWVGVRDPVPWVALHGLLEEHLARRGFPVEGRAYRPHVTCGRVRETRDPSALQREIASRGAMPFGDFEVGELVLLESLLGRGGSRYVRLASAPLGR